MQRTKTVTYQSCDFCDNPEETIVACNICRRYLCARHMCDYPWGDQMYHFCFKHYTLVHSIIEQTGIPIGYIVYKLTAVAPHIYTEKEFEARGYAALWNDEWKQQV